MKFHLHEIRKKLIKVVQDDINKNTSEIKKLYNKKITCISDIKKYKYAISKLKEQNEDFDDLIGKINEPLYIKLLKLEINTIDLETD